MWSNLIKIIRLLFIYTIMLRVRIERIVWYILAIILFYRMSSLRLFSWQVMSNTVVINLRQICRACWSIITCLSLVQKLCNIYFFQKNDIIIGVVFNFKEKKVVCWFALVSDHPGCRVGFFFWVSLFFFFFFFIEVNRNRKNDIIKIVID